MPCRKLTAALLALTLLSGGCERHGAAQRGSITVKLPPARAAAPAPGFSVDALGTPRPPPEA